MSSQNRKYFRFRFFRILFFLILFISPTTPTTSKLGLPESCFQLARTLMTSQSDNEFNKYLVQCLASVEWQQLSDFTIQKFQELKDKIPPGIAESVKGSLFIVSVHLICLSNLLYQQAVILAEDCKEHRDMFKELQTKMKVVLQAIKTEIYSMPKSIDFPTMHERITKVMKILNNFYTELEQVTNDVKNGIISSRLHKIIVIGCGVVALVVCVGSPFVAGPRRVFLICAPALGGVAYSIASYLSLGTTNEELNQLLKDTRKLRQEAAKHRAQLQVILALLKGKLNHSMPGRYALHQTRNSLNSGPDFKDCLLFHP